MSDQPIPTSKLNTVTILKLSIIGLLICGFVYSCNSSKKSQKAEALPSNNHQNKEVTDYTKQAAKQTDPGSKKKKIEKNWEAFFSNSTKTKKRIKLLQNGKQFKKAIKSFNDSKMAKEASAKVNDVKMNDDGTATVTYTIEVGGSPVLKNKKGKAVHENGTWKVSDAAFCSLLKLSGKTPSACKDTGGSSSGSQKEA
jgi:arsenate reductase-like glutaredoxin family protein